MNALCVLSTTLSSAFCLRCISQACRGTMEVGTYNNKKEKNKKKAWILHPFSQAFSFDMKQNSYLCILQSTEHVLMLHVHNMK